MATFSELVDQIQKEQGGGTGSRVSNTLLPETRDNSFDSYMKQRLSQQQPQTTVQPDVAQEEPGFFDNIGTDLAIGSAQAGRAWDYWFGSDQEYQESNKQVQELVNQLPEGARESFWHSLVQSLPITGLGIVAGVLAGGTAGLGAAALGLGTAGRVGLGMLAGGATEGGIAGGVAGADTKAQLDEMSNAEIADTPLYQTLRAQGLNHSEAKKETIRQTVNEVATKVGLATTALGAPLGGVAGAVGGRVAGGWAGQTAKKLGASPIIGGAAGEAVQEGLQSGAESYLTKSTLQENIDESIDPMEGILGDALTGAAAGGIIGGSIGGAYKGATALQGRRKAAQEIRKQRLEARKAEREAQAKQEEKEQKDTEYQARKESEERFDALATPQKLKTLQKKLGLQTKKTSASEAKLLDSLGLDVGQKAETPKGATDSPQQFFELVKILSRGDIKAKITKAIDEDVKSSTPERTQQLDVAAREQVEKLHGDNYEAVLDAIENSSLSDVEKAQTTNSVNAVYEFLVVSRKNQLVTTDRGIREEQTAASRDEEAAQYREAEESDVYRQSMRDISDSISRSQSGLPTLEQFRSENDLPQRVRGNIEESRAAREASQAPFNRREQEREPTRDELHDEQIMRIIENENKAIREQEAQAEQERLREEELFYQQALEDAEEYDSRLEGEYSEAESDFYKDKGLDTIRDMPALLPPPNPKDKTLPPVDLTAWEELNPRQRGIVNKEYKSNFELAQKVLEDDRLNSNIDFVNKVNEAIRVAAQNRVDSFVSSNRERDSGRYKTLPIVDIPYGIRGFSSSTREQNKEADDFLTSVDELLQMSDKRDIEIEKQKLSEAADQLLTNAKEQPQMLTDEGYRFEQQRLKEERSNEVSSQADARLSQMGKGKTTSTTIQPVEPTTPDAVVNRLKRFNQTFELPGSMSGRPAPKTAAEIKSFLEPVENLIKNVSITKKGEPDQKGIDLLEQTKESLLRLKSQNVRGTKTQIDARIKQIENKLSIILEEDKQDVSDVPEDKGGGNKKSTRAKGEPKKKTKRQEQVAEKKQQAPEQPQEPIKKEVSETQPAKREKLSLPNKTETKSDGKTETRVSPTGNEDTVRAKGKRYILASVNAMNADMSALELAKRLKENNEPSRGLDQWIWDQTGWYPSSDGVWKFEIDDTKFTVNMEPLLKFKNSKGINRVALRDVINHEGFATRYPALYDGVNIYIDPKRSGTMNWASVDQGDIYISPDILEAPDKVRTTLIHEIQHIVQFFEDMARGTGPAHSDYSSVTKLGKLKAAIEEATEKPTKNSGLGVIDKQELMSLVDKLIEDSPKIKNLRTQLDRLNKEQEFIDGHIEKHSANENKKIEELNGKGRYTEAGKVREKVLTYLDRQHKRLDEIKQHINKIQSYLNDKYRSIRGLYTLVDIQYKLYRMSAGETEARNVEQRSRPNFSGKSLAPPLTQDISPQHTIHDVFGRGEVFSMSFGSGTSTVESVKSELEKSGNDGVLKNGKVSVVNVSPEGTPKHIGGYFGEDGKMYLVASNIRKGSVVEFLLHENFHSTMEDIFGTAQFKNIMEGLGRLYDSGSKAHTKARLQARRSLKQLKRDLESKGDALTPEQERQVLLEEFGAYMIQTQSKLPIFRQIIAGARALIRKLFPSYKFTENDIRAFAIGALRKANRAKMLHSISKTRYKNRLYAFSMPFGQKHFDAIDREGLIKALNDLSTTVDAGYKNIVGRASEKGAANTLRMLKEAGGKMTRKLILMTMEPMEKAKLMGEKVSGGFLHNRLLHELDGELSRNATMYDDKIFQKLVPGHGRLQGASIAAGINKEYNKEELKLAQEAFNSITTLSTWLQIDPTSDGKGLSDNKVDGKTMKQWYSQLKTAFAKMPKEFQQAYKDMRDAYREISERIERATVIHMARVDPMKRAYESGTMDDFYKMIEHDIEALPESVASNKQKDNMRSMIKDARKVFKRNRSIVPYFPIRRRGTWFVRADINGKPYFSLVETATEFNELLAEYKSVKGAKILSSGRVLKGQDYMDKMGPTEGFMKELADNIDKNLENLSKKDKDQLKQNIWSTYLSTIPESPVRMAQLRRKDKVGGMATDSIRNFSEYVSTSARMISRLKWSGAIQRNLQDIREQVTKLPTKEQIYYGDLYEDMVEDYTSSINPNVSTWSKMVTKFGFNWTLGGSIGAAVMNTTQVPMVTYPTLKAHFKGLDVAKVMSQTWLGSMRVEASETFQYRKFSLEEAFKKLYNKWPKDEQELIKELERYDIINRTQASSAFEHEGIDSTSVKSQGSTKLIPAVWKAGINSILPALFHSAERLNRETTAISAYRLFKEDYYREESTSPDVKAFKKQYPKATQQQLFDAGFQFAVNIVDETQINMSATNRPKMLRGDVARAAFLFKQFPLHMTHWLIQNYWRGAVRPIIRNSMKVLGKENSWTAQETEEAIMDAERLARRKIIAVNGMGALLAGVTGVPFYSAVMTMLDIMDWFGEDDDEEEYYTYTDADSEFKQVIKDSLAFVGDMTNDTTEDFVQTTVRDGIFNALGLGMKDRIMLNEMFIRPFGDTDTVDGKMRVLYDFLLGPLGGTVRQFVEGHASLESGETWKAMEKFSPVFARNIIRMSRFAHEGVLTRQRNPIMEREDFILSDKPWTEDAIAIWRTFLQGMSIVPSELLERYEQNGVLRDAQEHVTKRRTRLLEEYYFAMLDGDEEKMKKIIEKTQVFNKANPEMKITISTLRRSMRERIRKGLEAVDGLVLDTKLAPRLEKQYRFNEV